MKIFWWVILLTIVVDVNGQTVAVDRPQTTCSVVGDTVVCN